MSSSKNRHWHEDMGKSFWAASLECLGALVSDGFTHRRHYHSLTRSESLIHSLTRTHIQTHTRTRGHTHARICCTCFMCWKSAGTKATYKSVRPNARFHGVFETSCCGFAHNTRSAGGRHDRKSFGGTSRLFLKCPPPGCPFGLMGTMFFFLQSRDAVKGERVRCRYVCSATDLASHILNEGLCIRTFLGACVCCVCVCVCFCFLFFLSQAWVAE